MKTRWVVMGVIAVLSLFTTPLISHADFQFDSCPSHPCLLSDLLTGKFIGIDEGGGVQKVFSNFHATFGVGVQLDPTKVSVQMDPTPPLPGEKGLLFQISGGLLVTTGQTSDTVLTYNADCKNCKLKDNTLAATAGMSPNGSFSISESVSSGATSLASKLVFANATSSRVIDHKDFTDPVTGLPVAVASIQVAKDIAVNGGTIAGSGAQISDFRQDFSQTTTVPEPTSLLLLGAGLAGLVGVGRLRRK